MSGGYGASTVVFLSDLIVFVVCMLVENLQYVHYTTITC